MTFLFGYLGSIFGWKDWPIHLMHQVEFAFVIVVVVCVLLVIVLNIRGGAPWMRNAVAAVGGISTSLGLIMPFELAPFFFGAPGEIMLASITLILVYPIAAFGLFYLFRRMMIDPPIQPPPLPTT